MTTTTTTSPASQTVDAMLDAAQRALDVNRECHLYATMAIHSARGIADARSSRPTYQHRLVPVSLFYRDVRELADRIIALRSQQVTP